jgi:aspartate/tyrosine/aromatic aminotransferase
LCDDFVVAVAVRVPWILAGHDDELERLWKANKPEMYRLLEERRQEFAAQLREEADDQDGDEISEVKPA